MQWRDKLTNNKNSNKMPEWNSIIIVWCSKVDATKKYMQGDISQHYM